MMNALAGAISNSVEFDATHESVRQGGLAGRGLGRDASAGRFIMPPELSSIDDTPHPLTVLVFADCPCVCLLP